MKDIDVLIIEDNLKVAKAHQLYVEKVSGFSVVGVVNLLTDAEQMVNILEPDLILLDIYFPDGNGMDFLDKIRSYHSDIDIILITAAKDVKLLHNALRGGVFDYMIKPVFFDRFEKALRNYRERWKSLKSLKNVNQAEVDCFFRHEHQVVTESAVQDVPKGIDPLTLRKITECFHDLPKNRATAEEVSQIIGASRVTARKYLEYLVSIGFLEVDIEYGTIGRPERRYLKS